MKNTTYSQAKKINLAILFAALREAGLSIADAARGLPVPKETLWRWQEKYIGGGSCWSTKPNRAFYKHLKTAGNSIVAVRKTITTELKRREK